MSKNQVFAENDTVMVPDPVPCTNDAWHHEFVGTIVRLWNDWQNGETHMATVEDMDGDCFDVETYRLEHAEE